MNFKILVLAAVFVAIIGVAAFHQGSVNAQTPTENAVVNCGDSDSKHGGSADNPPDCEEEEEIINQAVQAGMAKAQAQTAATCEPRTYTRTKTITDKIDGEVVGTFTVTEDITLNQCPTSSKGSTDIVYGSWTAK